MLVAQYKSSAMAYFKSQVMVPASMAGKNKHSQLSHSHTQAKQVTQVTSAHPTLLYLQL